VRGFGLFRNLFKSEVKESTDRRQEARVDAREGLRILVVDDSATVVAVLGRMLNQAFYEAYSADSGEAALESLNTSVPDLIFLDIVLPGMSGFAALRALRRDPRTANVPVIMISGNLKATEEFYGQRIGADDFMKKPFGRTEVFSRIQRLVEKGRLPAREIARDADSLEDEDLSVDDTVPADTDSVVDVEALDPGAAATPASDLSGSAEDPDTRVAGSCAPETLPSDVAATLDPTTFRGEASEPPTTTEPPSAAAPISPYATASAAVAGSVSAAALITAAADVADHPAPSDDDSAPSGVSTSAAPEDLAGTVAPENGGSVDAAETVEAGSTGSAAIDDSNPNAETPAAYAQQTGTLDDDTHGVSPGASATPAAEPNEHQVLDEPATGHADPVTSSENTGPGVADRNAADDTETQVPHPQGHSDAGNGEPQTAHARSESETGVVTTSEVTAAGDTDSPAPPLHGRSNADASSSSAAEPASADATIRALATVRTSVAAPVDPILSTPVFDDAPFPDPLEQPRTDPTASSDTAQTGIAQPDTTADSDTSKHQDKVPATATNEADDDVHPALRPEPRDPESKVLYEPPWERD
jgi:CheY-like chemotaxis protein